MIWRRKTISFLAVALLLGLLIFFSNTEAGQSMRSALLQVVRPLVSIADKARVAFGLGALTGTEARELIRENQRLKAENVEIEKLRIANDTLRKILSFSQESARPLRGVRVLLYSRESGRDFLLLASGSKDGIGEGDLVMDENRIFVGTVREAGETFSKVAIASSSGESVEVKILPSGDRALARGFGSRALILELIPAEAAIRRGDLVFLASSGGKPSLVLGEVVGEKNRSNVAFREARAIHLVRPEFLEEVFILK